MHYPSHQLLDHLLADDAILLARQFCGLVSSATLKHSYTVPPCHGVTMCRDLAHKVDAVKPHRAETDRFRT
jgi:hypothetical protein